jgi:hypothetical protein
LLRLLAQLITQRVFLTVERQLILSRCRAATFSLAGSKHVNYLQCEQVRICRCYSTYLDNRNNWLINSLMYNKSWKNVASYYTSCSTIFLLNYIQDDNEQVLRATTKKAKCTISTAMHLKK